MSLQKLFKAADLAAAPADAEVPSRIRGDKVGWVYGFNLSPFCIEILNERNGIVVISLPFAPFKAPLNERTDHVTVHISSAAMVPAAPLAAADLAFYITVSEFEPDLIPGPW